MECQLCMWYCHVLQPARGLQAALGGVWYGWRLSVLLWPSSSAPGDGIQAFTRTIPRCGWKDTAPQVQLQISLQIPAATCCMGHCWPCMATVSSVWCNPAAPHALFGQNEGGHSFKRPKTPPGHTAMPFGRRLAPLGRTKELPAGACWGCYLTSRHPIGARQKQDGSL